MSAEPGARTAPLLLDAEWSRLAAGWASASGMDVREEPTHMTLSMTHRPAGADELEVRLTTSRRFLVAFMTNGRGLAPGELARGAAAANAWNTEQLTPTLSVWNVRGTRPHLGGVCTLPLSCRLSQEDFDAVASGWIDQAVTMFARCREVFRL
ncbi:hypothetical protein [Streptomyces sp. NPDC006334]|uniref:hypothetical protein n=1 Tax=Streptomyces sp. NPDC006334 TaxID=3156754 RepID=UPI0033B51465